MSQNREKIVKLYKKYELTPEDVFKHQHYTIITRAGIDRYKLWNRSKLITMSLSVSLTLQLLKANAIKSDSSIETFGSALKGGTHRDGNCNTWYVMEMAEKRAMSRAVLN